LKPAVLELALEKGLGPILAHTTARGPTRDYPQASRIRAADLTAQVLTAEKYAAIEDVLAAAAGCRIALLKGASTALRYYPAPHLRTMGDVDLLVPSDQQAPLEASLRALGFEQHSRQALEAFANRHHSMPFWHPQRDIWIDVHTRLHPPQHPMAHVSWLTSDPAMAGFSPVQIGRQSAYAMRHETQLIYTSARWLEAFDSQRGVYPLLDAALLLQKHAGTLDWDYIRVAVDRSWATTALQIMLSLLSTWHLARVPCEVVTWLAASDPHVNRTSHWLLYRMVLRYVMTSAPPGLMTTRTLELMWTALVRGASPLASLLCTPYYLAFPPRQRDRFGPARAMRRLRTVVRRQQH
jgi:hypothetical protein